MGKLTILVVDDDLAIIKLLRTNLEVAGYSVIVAKNGAEALNEVERKLPDLILLDITMPGIDGFEVCQSIREWSQVPIIMVTARGDEQDKVKCLNMGADDYIAKPFGIDELMARVRAVLRRVTFKGAETQQSAFTHGFLTVNFSRRQVTVSGKEIKVTPTEYNLLQELAINAGKVLTYSHLLQKVWGEEYQDEKEYLHVFIGRLRAKLDRKTAKDSCIESVFGVGYKLKI
jgi:DNA-binding response OmpR family regulator